MSSWLQRYLRPQTELTSSRTQSQSTGSQPFAPGRTTYISTNTAEQKSFYAEAPAGSQHAARLQKLALQQQPEYRPPKPNAGQMLERKVQRGLTAHGESAGYDADDADGAITSPASTGQAGRRRSDTVLSGCAPSGQSRRQPTHVDRYERDGMMAYHKKAAGGELLISAPVGSQEARSMDDTAARLLAAQTAHPTGYVEDGERPLILKRRPKGTR